MGGNKQKVNQITGTIIDSAIEVHSALGPGLLESAYEACLSYELAERGLNVEPQKPLPVEYKRIRLDLAYRLDLLVEDLVIVEIKAVDRVLPIHKAQLLSYLRISGRNVGLVLNFNVRLMKNGIHRYVHGELFRT